jgi:hypothetical protein
MRRPRSLLVPFVIVGLIVSAEGSAQSARAADARHCRDVGPPQTDVGLYKITATRVSCRRARAILNRWYKDPSAPHSGPRGWKCSRRRTSSYSFRTTCRRRGAQIGFAQFSA